MWNCTSRGSITRHLLILDLSGYPYQVVDVQVKTSSQTGHVVRALIKLHSYIVTNSRPSLNPFRPAVYWPVSEIMLMILPMSALFHICRSWFDRSCFEEAAFCAIVWHLGKRYGNTRMVSSTCCWIRQDLNVLYYLGYWFVNAKRLIILYVKGVCAWSMILCHMLRIQTNILKFAEEFSLFFWRWEAW
jgi:hypothetical protein